MYILKQFFSQWMHWVKLFPFLVSLLRFFHFLNSKWKSAMSCILESFFWGIAFPISVFCCVGALAITGSLDLIDKDLLGWWLCERQVKSGGLNGRPEKDPDVSKAFQV